MADPLRPGDPGPFNGMEDVANPAAYRNQQVLDSVHKEYQDWLTANPKGEPVDLSTFAKGMDAREGTTRRSPAYFENTSPVAAYSQGANEALESTGLPHLGALIGGGAGAALDTVLGTGTTIGDVGEQIGHAAPRTMAPILAGPAAPAVMTADAMAQKYAESGGNLPQTGLTGALTAGTLGLAHVGGQVGEKLMADKLINAFSKTGAPASLESLSTGLAPKLARTAGAVAGGATGQELGHQVESVQKTGELANPLTVQNIASQVMGGALMAGPDIAATYATKSALNRGAQDRLAAWANDRAAQAMADRQVKPPMGYTNTDALIKQSIQQAEPGTDWRRGLILDNINSMSTETDPVQRTGTLGRLTDAVLKSRNMAAITDSAESTAKLAYVKPPGDIVGLTDLARRVNTLKEDALRRLDEMAASGDEKAPSAAAYRQMEQAGFIKEPVTLDWLKSRFGDNVERSLSNSNANGYLMLTQQLANEMLMLSEAGKQVRGEAVREQSVASPGLSSDILGDRMRLANFFDAVAKVGDPKLREGLLDRYLHHEGEDNVKDTGTGSKFMDEITGVINSVTGGKTPEDVAKINWANTKGTTIRGTREVDPATGQEVRGTREQTVGLSDYLAKDADGEYVRKVYGRPNRSQREIPESQIGQAGQAKPTDRAAQEAKSEQELYQVGKEKVSPLEQVPAGQSPTPQGRDWAAAIDQVKQKLATSTDDEVWKTIAPELMNSYGRVDPRLEARLRPVAKDLAQAVFELGPATTNKAAGIGEVSESGMRVLKALKPDAQPTNTASQLSQVLRNIFFSRGDQTVRQGIVRRIAEKAGVEVPKAARVASRIKGYHGGPPNLSNLQLDKGNEGSLFFVNNPEVAKTYSGPKGKVYERNLDIRNPLVYDADSESYPQGVTNLKEFINYAKQRGHDGLIINNVSDPGPFAKPGDDPYHTQYIPFDQAQVKEDINTLGASGLGQPVYDAHRLFKNFFYRLGYEPDLADHFTRLSMQTVLNFKNNDLQIAPLDQASAYNALRTSFNTLANAGFYGGPGVTPNSKPIIGLALDHYAGEAPKALVAWHALSVLTHELVHDIQDQAEAYHDLVPATAYSKERVGAYQQLARMAEFYSPQQRFAFLRAVADATIPKSLLYSGDPAWENRVQGGNRRMHPTIEGNLRYGAGVDFQGNPSGEPSYEFVNTFAQILGLGMLTGGNSSKLLPEQVYSWMPEEQQLFAKGVYRDLHDNLDALRTAVHDPKFREAAGLSQLTAPFSGSTSFLAHQLEQLVKNTHTMVMGADPSQSAVEAQRLASALDQGLFGNWSPQPVRLEVPGAMGAKVKREPQELVQGLLFQGMEPAPTTKKEGSTAGPIRPDGRQLMLDLPEDPKNPGPNKVDVSLFWKWGTLFQQGLEHLRKRGITLGDDVAATIREFVPAQNRVALGLWQPFLQPGGKFDPNNPLVAMRMDKSPQGRADNTTLNRIMNWQQRNEAEALEKQPDGTYKLSDDASKDLKLTDIPQRVAGAVVKMSEVGQVLGTHLVESRVNSAANRTARMLMTLQPDELGSLPWNKAQADATKIVRGLVYGQQSLAAAGLTPYPEPMREAVLGLLNSGVVEAIKDLNTQVQSRTWWMTEQRPGNYLVESYDKDGVRHVDGATDAIQAMKAKQELEGRGFTNVNVISRADKQKAQSFDAPENILQHYMDLEQAHFDKYLASNPNGLTPEQLATIRAYAPSPGEATTAMLERKGTNKFTVTRKSVPAAFGLDYTDNMRDYIGRLAATTSRQAINQKIELILADDRMRGQDAFASYVRDNVRQMMTPSTAFERSAKAFTNAYFMAANLSSAFVIATHPINTVPETLLTATDQPGYGLGDAARHASQGVADAIRFGGKQISSEDQNLLRTAQAKVVKGQALSTDEAKVYAFNKALQDKVLDAGLLQDITSDHDADLRILAQKTFGTGGQMPTGSAGLLTDGLYRVSKASMWIPRLAANFNNQAVFMAGLNQALEQGMNVRDAFTHADKVRTLALFAGGKSNSPGWIAAAGKENTIPVFRVMHSLQQFGVGLYGRWADHISDAITSDPNLTSGQRVQALKAAGTMLATQLAMAGVLGLPLAAAGMALLEKKFGVNAEASVREGIAKLTGADKDNTGFRGLVTELAMNGVPNQLIGVNIGPRLGVTDYMGTSAYDGFNLADLLGPSGSLVANVFNGLGYAAQGEGQKAATSLLPNVFKRPVDMAMNKMKFGDYAFRDPTGQKLYDPTTSDLLRYAAGVNPAALSERQRMKRLVDVSNQQWVKKNADEEDQRAAAMVQGDARPTYDWVRDQVGQGLLAPSQIPSAIRHVADKGLETQQMRDPLASGPVGNATEQRAIVQTFPQQDTSRQSELARLSQRIPVEARAGVPKSDYSQDMARAAVIDAMTAKGLTKGQAERVAVMLGL